MWARGIGVHTCNHANLLLHVGHVRKLQDRPPHQHAVAHSQLPDMLGHGAVWVGLHNEVKVAPAAIAIHSNDLKMKSESCRACTVGNMEADAQQVSFGLLLCVYSSRRRRTQRCEAQCSKV